MHAQDMAFLMDKAEEVAGSLTALASNSEAIAESLSAIQVRLEEIDRHLVEVIDRE